MSQNAKDRLQAIARRAMLERGFEPDLPPQARQELQRLAAPNVSGLRDLRHLPWSSIDNEDSRDLDQLEVLDAPRDGCRVLLVAIADVDLLVQRQSALDDHARTNTTSVYTPAAVFPMLPDVLSTDRTSLNFGDDRAAIVIELQADANGRIASSTVFRALVHNRARLSYPEVGAWLDGAGPAPRALSAVPGLDRQIREQDELAQQLRDRSHDDGALDLERVEAQFTVRHESVEDVASTGHMRARDLIEHFMVAANGATARFLADRGFPSIRRVVRTPKRWDRIVEVAARYGSTLPAAPDVVALQRFLQERRAAAPAEFSDLSLTIIKLLGSGEYDARPAGSPPEPHFALATQAYTHATAPNRRFPDLITQRLLKAALEQHGTPYSLVDLTALAGHCTRQEDAANKVERLVRKAAAALWIGQRIGDVFDGIVTGAGPKGTWVRLRTPPIEGKLERGFEGLDVGDRVRVRLIETDPDRGFIDFARS
jgi:exoribonuclease-2